MNFKKSFLISLLSLNGLIAGCGGSSGPEAPQNPIVLTSQNALPIADASVAYADVSTTLVGAEANIPNAKKALDTVVNIAFDKNRLIPSVVQGITTSLPCGTDGNSGSTDFTGDTTLTTSTGTITFNNCIEFGITMNGSFTISSEWNDATTYYSDSGVGSLSMSIDGLSFTMGIDYSETGYTNTGEFTSEIAFSISSPQFPGFMVATTQPLTGFYQDIDAGELTVSGGSNTSLKIIFTGTNIADVYLDDNGDGFYNHEGTIFRTPL